MYLKQIYDESFTKQSQKNLALEKQSFYYVFIDETQNKTTYTHGHMGM